MKKALAAVLMVVGALTACNADEPQQQQSPESQAQVATLRSQLDTAQDELRQAQSELQQAELREAKLADASRFLVRQYRKAVSCMDQIDGAISNRAYVWDTLIPVLNSPECQSVHPGIWEINP